MDKKAKKETTNKQREKKNETSMGRIGQELIYPDASPLTGPDDPNKSPLSEEQ